MITLKTNYIGGITMTIIMNLPTYEKYAEYKGRLIKKIETISKQIESNESGMESLSLEYSKLFREGKDTNAVMNGLNGLKLSTKALKDELAIIEETDLSEYELGKKVIAEFHEKKNEVTAEMNRKYKEIEVKKKQLYKEIEEANAYVNELAADFQEVVNQYNYVKGCFAKKNIKDRVMANGWEPSPGFINVYQIRNLDNATMAGIE
jgi:chromosome segregation ATPase